MDALMLALFVNVQNPVCTSVWSLSGNEAMVGIGGSQVKIRSAGAGGSLRTSHAAVQCWMEDAGVEVGRRGGFR